jgi:hypothetical protein
MRGRDWTTRELCYLRGLAIREKLLTANHPRIAERLDDYAAFLRKAGRGEEAAQMEDRAESARQGTN